MNVRLCVEVMTKEKNMRVKNRVYSMMMGLEALFAKAMDIRMAHSG